MKNKDSTYQGSMKYGFLNMVSILQESPLGQTLLITYLNNFEKCLEFSIAIMYADETRVTLTTNDVELQMPAKN